MSNSNHNGGTFERVSIGSADAVPAQPLAKPASGVTTYVGNGPKFFSLGAAGSDAGRSMLHGAHSRVTGVSVGGPIEDGSVLGTARKAAGGFGVAAHAVTDDTIVTAGGMPMRVREAVREGFLVRNADGSYSEAQRG